MQSNRICIPSPTASYRCVTREADGLTLGTRVLAEETPVAFVYGGSTEAVMMATPADLEDFAVGFGRNEGIIEGYKDINDFATVHGESGIELRMWLRAGLEERYRKRRRRLAGPTGCGLCGIESLAEAIRPPRKVGDGGRIRSQQVSKSLEMLAARQSLGAAPRAAHAAGFWTAEAGLSLVRE